VVVAVQLLVERFQRPPVLANGSLSESWPPQTNIWSVTSMRVKTAECAVRAVGAFTTEIGDQPSARAAEAMTRSARQTTERSMIRCVFV
jgi:hypothetical protein